MEATLVVYFRKYSDIFNSKSSNLKKLS